MAELQNLERSSGSGWSMHDYILTYIIQALKVTVNERYDTIVKMF